MLYLNDEKNKQYSTIYKELFEMYNEVVTERDTLKKEIYESKQNSDQLQIDHSKSEIDHLEESISNLNDNVEQKELHESEQFQIVHSKFEIDHLEESISNLNDEIKKKDEIIRKLNNTIYEKEKKMDIMSCPYKTLQLKGFNDKKSYLYYLQNSECAYCERRINLEHMTQEHLVPKSLKGTNHIGNICLVCKKCNRIRKNNMNDKEFIEVLIKRICNPMWWY